MFQNCFFETLLSGVIVDQFHFILIVHITYGNQYFLDSQQFSSFLLHVKLFYQDFLLMPGDRKGIFIYIKRKK